jgi:hypothetical protein
VKWFIHSPLVPFAHLGLDLAHDWADRRGYEKLARGLWLLARILPLVELVVLVLQELPMFE